MWLNSDWAWKPDAAILEYEEEAMHDGVRRKKGPGFLTLWRVLPTLDCFFNFLINWDVKLTWKRTGNFSSFSYGKSVSFSMRPGNPYSVQQHYLNVRRCYQKTVPKHTCHTPFHESLDSVDHSESSSHWWYPTSVGTISFRNEFLTSSGQIRFDTTFVTGLWERNFLAFLRESLGETFSLSLGCGRGSRKPPWICWQPSMAMTCNSFTTKWSPQKAECRKRKTIFGDIVECCIKL